ncbi:MAG: sigma-70 family RNA polymerase sigma factor [Candidatus Sumerlaeia bacterium]|nr:sigma-70 family RNA polymerase sigma factor [Candidatus Sumerlaeia bacterium]
MYIEDRFEDDGLQDYLKQVGSHRLLNREEEVELFQRLEGGDTSAREELARCNLRLVIKIAMQFRGMGVTTADLIQEGNIGLLQVIDRFDWRRGFRFSTYAAFWIRQEIQASIRNTSSFIRLPARKGRLMGKISEVIRSFNNMEGRDPSVEEIAGLLGEDVEKVRTLLPLRESVVSLDGDAGREGYQLLDKVTCELPLPGARLAEDDRKRLVHESLDVLSERERSVVDLRFGMSNGKSMSLRKVSKRVGLSQEGVRRVEMRAISKLNRPTVRQQLEHLMTA